MASGVHRGGGMRHHTGRPTRTRRLAATGAALLALAVVAGAAAAPSDESVLPLDQYTSEKGRTLARTHDRALRDLAFRLYHCMPWVEVQKHSVGFFKPKHLTGDTRYLSVRLYIEQEPSAPFTAMAVEERASSMFSRYVGPMLRRMAGPALLADAALDGFTVILEWLKQAPQRPGERPIHETIAVFVDKPTAVEYLAGRLHAGDLAARVRVLGWDGETALGPLRVAGWEDNFLATFKVKNYEVAPGVACP